MSLTSRLKRALSARSAVQRFGRRSHADDVRALLGQQPLQVFARIRLVVHREDAQTGERLVGAASWPAAPVRRPTARHARLRRGNRTREHRALAASLAVHGDRAAVRFDQLPGDRQPQAQAGEAPRAAAIGLAEFLEDMRQELGRDAFAAVAHLAVGHSRHRRR